jgi:hypothetical protein
VTHEQGNSESVIEKGRKAVTSDWLQLYP